MKFRIKQLKNGNFIIEKKVTKNKGFLWWKKEVKMWTMCNRLGDPIFSDDESFQTYPTVKKAKKQFKVWKSAGKTIEL
jgi:hypothetical protein